MLPRSIYRELSWSVSELPYVPPRSWRRIPTSRNRPLRMISWIIKLSSNINKMSCLPVQSIPYKSSVSRGLFRGLAIGPPILGMLARRDPRLSRRPAKRAAGWAGLDCRDRARACDCMSAPRECRSFRLSKGMTRTAASLSPPAIEPPRHRDGTIEQGHDLEKIVVGNEPAVSGGFGSLSQTHNTKDAM